MYHSLELIVILVTLFAFGAIAYAIELYYSLRSEYTFTKLSKYGLILFGIIVYPIALAVITIIPPLQLYYLIWPYRLYKKRKELSKEPTNQEMRDIHLNEGIIAALQGDHSNYTNYRYLTSLDPKIHNETFKTVLKHILEEDEFREFFPFLVKRVFSFDILEEIFESDVDVYTGGPKYRGQLALRRMRELSPSRADLFLVDYTKNTEAYFPIMEMIHSAEILTELRGWARDFDREHPNFGMETWLEEQIVKVRENTLGVRITRFFHERF